MFVGMLVCKTCNHVDFRSDCDRCSFWQIIDEIYDVLRRSIRVRHLNRLFGAFRMNDDHTIWMTLTEIGNLAGFESLMDRTESMPENDTRIG